VTTSISAVAASQPERLVTAAAEVGTQAAQLDNLIATQRDSVNKLREGWSGPAADEALVRGEQNLASQEELRDKLQTLQAVLSAGGGQLSSARTALLDLVGQLQGQGWQVSDDGVTAAPPNLSAAFRSFPQAYTLLIQKLLKSYDSIDSATAGNFPAFDEWGAGA
jgi:uncharacterized protein YukE